MTTVDGNMETLARAILNEAQTEIDDISGGARSQAEEILQRARAEAERMRAAAIERAREDARRLKDQGAATAQLKARTLELEHREMLLDRVFEAATERLRTGLPKTELTTAAARLLQEAIDQLRTGSVVIRADPATRAALTDTSLAQIGRDAGVELQWGETLESGTGIVVQSPDGRLQFDNTFENRLARLKALLRSEVYKVLLGESS